MPTLVQCKRRFPYSLLGKKDLWKAANSDQESEVIHLSENGDHR